MNKNILAAFSLLSLSLSSQASHFGEYNKEQIAFANKLLLCPQEVASIMGAPYTKIIEAGFAGGQTPEGVITDYTITFAQILPAPSFKETKTVLVVRESIIPLNIAAPDAPSFKKVIRCEVK